MAVPPETVHKRADSSHLHFASLEKKKREQKAAESIGRQTGCARAVPVVWFWQLNWPQCCRCVMFKGRFKVMLSTGLAASDILNIYTFSVAG